MKVIKIRRNYTAAISITLGNSQNYLI